MTKKKTILIFFAVFMTICFNSTRVCSQDSKPIEAGVSFDWISKTQMQRDENIEKTRQEIFNGVTLSYPKKEFRAQNKAFLRDSNYLNNFEDISNGKKEDEKAYYCAFKWGETSVMVMYGIQYKDDLKRVFYYDALGRLWFIDVFSDEYPVFPYKSYQYNVNGKLIAAYFYKASYDQYAFDAQQNFKGRWFKENYYNRKAKIILTRTNW